MVKDLPYPYTSKAQFERSIDTPLGTEWNTRVGFQRGTLPKVVKKVCCLLYLINRTMDSPHLSDGYCYQSTGETVLDELPSFINPYNMYGAVTPSPASQTMIHLLVTLVVSILVVVQMTEVGTTYV